jgi:galactose oxidase-like protein
MAHSLLFRAARKSLRTVHPSLPDWVERQSLRLRARWNRKTFAWTLSEDRTTPRRLDAGAIQLGDALYVIGGYVTSDEVLSQVDVLDLQKRKWRDRFPMPSTMAQSHLALTSDGEKWIYAVSGQLGNQCHPPTRQCFALDVTRRVWQELPPLPEARYAATLQLWDGRLHLVGGSKEDRATPACEHWSLGVSDGVALDATWKTEIPIPRGGPHRASAICDNRFFVFGGQEGDYVPVPGDPLCRCDGDRVTEMHHAEVYFQENPAAPWVRAADLAVPASHTEFSLIQLGHRVVLFGGQHHRDASTRRMTLTDTVQLYDTRRNRGEVIGRLPYRVKTNVVALHRGMLFSTAGQRDRSWLDAAPGDIVNHVWTAAALWPDEVTR